MTFYFTAAFAAFFLFSYDWRCRYRRFEQLCILIVEQRRVDLVQHHIRCVVDELRVLYGGLTGAVALIQSEEILGSHHVAVRAFDDVVGVTIEVSNVDVRAVVGHGEAAESVRCGVQKGSLIRLVGYQFAVEIDRVILDVVTNEALNLGTDQSHDGIHLAHGIGVVACRFVL